MITTIDISDVESINKSRKENAQVTHRLVIKWDQPTNQYQPHCCLATLQISLLP